MNVRYILAHDLGTTGDKAALFDEGGRLIASSEAPYPTWETPDGAAEQNPDDWLRAVGAATRELISRNSIRPSRIAAVSLSGHMMGVVALDKRAKPVRPAILHSDVRSASQALAIAEIIPAEEIHKISGNPLDAHYPMSKIAWLLAKEPEICAQTVNFVQSKDYVTGWLTGETDGRLVTTDYSDASLYGCFDLHRMTWSPALCEAAGIDCRTLPDIAAAGSLAGGVCAEAARELGVSEGTPVYTGFGDGAAAALGAGAWRPGACYSYVGSTSWVSATTDQPIIDTERRLFTLALTQARFSSIGTVQCAGAAWDWAVETLCGGDYDEAESLAEAACPGSDGLIFLPYLRGERSPIWNERARGVWFGLSVSHSRRELLRSVLEGVSLALGGILNDIARCTHAPPEAVTIIGGGLRSRLWTQILTAALGGRARLVEETSQATARGAMLAGALGAGIISSFDESECFSLPFRPLVSRASLVQASEAAKPVFQSLYRRLAPAFDDLARMRLRLAALEVEESRNAAV